MAVQSTVPGTGYNNPYLDSLISGYVWSGTPIRVAFAVGPFRKNGTENGTAGTGASWTAAEKQAFLQVMAEYEAVANIDFQVTGDYSRADILWYKVGSGIIPADADAAHAYPSGQYGQVYGYFRQDVESWGYFQSGGASYETILHELGHGLGLEHPHLDDADTASHVAFPGVVSASDLGDNNENQRVFSVMSYNSGWDQAWWNYDRGNVITPMAFDIAALQRMYGANTQYHKYDDSYSLGPYWDTAGTGWRCIWDAGGIDTISAVGADVNAHIELRAATLAAGDPNAGGFVSYYFTGGAGAPRSVVVAGGLTIANGVVIENAIGGRGDDELIGNSTHNNLTGGEGADLLDGREGYDTAIYDTAHYGVFQIVDMLNPWFGTLDARGDSFVSIEAVLGSPTEDIISGTDGVEALSGRGSGDVLQGRWGGDILDGGEGFDLAGFESGVTADLMFSYLNTGEAAGDTFVSIEGLWGSMDADDLRGDGNDNRLYGNDRNDQLRGRAGNDTLEGGGWNDRLWGDQGSDLLDGGTGRDTMVGGTGDDFFVVDDVFDQAIEYANEGVDTVIARVGLTLAANIERVEIDGNNDLTVIGNDLDNDIVGNSRNAAGYGGDNVLFGMAGNDTIDGLDGSDTIDGGDGDDLVMIGSFRGDDVSIGGEGSDTLALVRDFGGDITFDLTWGTIPLFYGSVTWSGFENLRGGAGDNVLYGDDANNRLEGLDGNDELHGRGGNDLLEGGSGFDALFGEEGDDTLVGSYEYSVYGVEFMDGGEGSDTADFSAHGKALWIDLMYPGREVWTRDQADVEWSTWRQVADLVSIENLVGSAGSDKLWGDDTANRIDGGAGHDFIDGRDGNDTLTGGLGFDEIHGGAGDDTLAATYEYSVYGVDDMDGGEGDDTADFSAYGKAVWVDLAYPGREAWTTDSTDLASGPGWREIADLVSIENVTGSALHDYLAGDGNANVFAGGGGNDIIAGGDGTDTAAFGGSRAGYIFTLLADGSLQIADALGTDGIDTLTGIENFRFADGDIAPTLGTDVANTIAGTDAADFVLGFLGHDKLYGGLDADTLLGGDGNDRLDGQAGDDVLTGGDGADVFVGGAGIDTADYSAAATTVFADLGNLTPQDGAALGDRFSGVENLIGGASGDILSGNASANRLDGGSSHDQLFGFAGLDTLLGGEGDDTLDGGAANDAIEGGNGADWIVGGAGSDTLTGGAGADTFVFQSLADKRDTIADFTAGEDLIALSASGFGIADLADIGFVAGGAPRAGDGACFLYNTNSGLLSFDADGRGGAAAVGLAVLTDLPNLTMNDLVLI